MLMISAILVWRRGPIWNKTGLIKKMEKVGKVESKTGDLFRLLLRMIRSSGFNSIFFPFGPDVLLFLMGYEKNLVLGREL